MTRSATRMLRLVAAALFVFAVVPGPRAVARVVIVESSWLEHGIRDEAVAAGNDAGLLVFSADDQVGRIVGGAGVPPEAFVVQVVPLETAIGAPHFGTWRALLPDAGRKAGAFVLDNGIIRGNGKFGRIRVLPLTRPGDWPKRPVAVIDPGFFLALYKDEVRTPMIGLVMKLVKTLRTAGVEPQRTWVVDRNRDMAFPLEFGYLPDLIREASEDAAAFRDTLPEKWARLDRAQYLAFFAQTDEAMAEYGALIRSGGPPAAGYQAAQLAIRHRDLEAGVAFLEAAGKADPDYARGFLVEGLKLQGRGELEVAEALLRAGRRLFPGSELMAIALARLLAEQARVWRSDAARSGRLIEEAVSLPVPEAVRDEIRARRGD